MKKDNQKNQYRVNGQIHVREVRVVSDDGSQVMPTRQALDLAHQQGVDLVEISPNAQPPVCRLIDYSKFLYQQKKRAKEMKHRKVSFIIILHFHSFGDLFSTRFVTVLSFKF